MEIANLKVYNIMPQTQQGILKDFNILLKDTTHFKCILRQI